MDRAEARALGLGRLDELRALGWAELRDRYLDRQELDELVGASGAAYQVVTIARWESEPGGDLRVSVLVDDGGWRPFAPLNVDLVVRPDDSVAAE